ncbi:hypothetical protein CEP54_000287 [Fusarium duplospermum]|uniref:Methyltransferase domain-containing protein n=1 Tax=Fusarium duplospermum TaxID=1325734 RepID=A0A428R877_9HYPO|nr:hypothetical protein CEP54_000287 [Fusarium duplospermum]
MADQDTELSTERPQTPTTRFSASSGSPSFGEAIEKSPALSSDETQVESSESPLNEETSPLGSPHERSLIDDDDDSTFEEDAESTESLGEEYEEIINGRKYTTFFPGVYSWTPTEDDSKEMMDMIHVAITELFGGKLCQAPVMDEAQRVFDVGTGTGIWAIDFADSNPQAEVHGSDISLIQPDMVPPNLSLSMEVQLQRSFTVADDETQGEAMKKAGFVDLKRYYKPTASAREGLNWDPSLYTWPRHIQETSDEISSDEINTPASTTSDSFARVSLPPTAPAAPASNAPLNGRLGRGLLELISLYQITIDHRRYPIDPVRYIIELEAFGEEHFARRLVVQIEEFFELSQRYELTLEDRIQDVKQRCDFLECPRYERPNISPLDTRDWICEVERYETTKINYPAWPEKQVQSYALVCLSQLFGRLHYTPPTNMCPDQIPSATALLISLHEKRRGHYGIGCFTPTISLKLRDPGFLEVLGRHYRLQKEEGEFLATCEDWQYIQDRGRNSYIQRLFWYCIQQHDQNPKFEDSELLDYKELASRFQGIPDTDKTVSRLIEDLQTFQKASTDFMDWDKEDTSTLTLLYAVQLLAVLGYKVSLKDFLRDPRRVLQNIYFLLQWESSENNHEFSPETPPRSSYGRDADELPPLGSDTESLSDGEGDDGALNSDVDTDDHMNADDCYRLLDTFNDDSRHLLLRLFGLWVAIKERNVAEGRASRADECVLRSWRTLANLVLSSGLNGAISTIESQLPRVPSTEATVLERVRHFPQRN